MKNIMKRIVGYFLKGLLYAVPLAVTIYILYLSFTFVDGLLPFEIPGLGLLIIIVLITLIGFFGQLFITAPIYAKVEKLLNRAPLIKVIYSSVRDFLMAFVGNNKKFTNPVLVKTDVSAEMERIGFITEKNLEVLGIEDKIAVYFPSSYGILGELYIVPTKNITTINVHPAEIMKFIVSGGVSKIDLSNTKNK